MKIRLLAALMLLAAPAFAQDSAPALSYGWAPKPVAAPFVAPNRAHWRLADIQKAHAKQKSWSQIVVRDPLGLTGTYIQTAPGEITPRVMYSDSTTFFIVQSGQLRVTIDGVEPFIATKGFVVQIPSVRFVQLETLGATPALRFSVTQTMAPPVYAIGEVPKPVRGFSYARAGYYTLPYTYGTNKPFIDYYRDISGTGMRGAVQDDFISANINRAMGRSRPSNRDKGHFHIGTSEFWFVIEGQVNFLIEGVPYFTAAQGDIVYAPAGRWHRATSGGTGIGARLAIHPVGTALKALDPDTAYAEDMD